MTDRFDDFPVAPSITPEGSTSILADIAIETAVSIAGPVLDLFQENKFLKFVRGNNLLEWALSAFSNSLDSSSDSECAKDAMPDAGIQKNQPSQ